MAEQRAPARHRSGPRLVAALTASCLILSACGGSGGGHRKTTVAQVTHSQTQTTTTTTEASKPETHTATTTVAVKPKPPLTVHTTTTPPAPVSTKAATVTVTHIALRTTTPRTKTPRTTTPRTRPVTRPHPRASVKTVRVNEPRASGGQAKLVLSCLRRSHLKDATASASYLWVGWDPRVGGFVYITLYPTVRSAGIEAAHYADEETGLARQLVISQHIAPYKGSPVPQVTTCLGGRMISKPPPKQVKRFTF